MRGHIIELPILNDIDEDSDQSLDLVLLDLSVKEAFVHMQ